MFLAEQLDDETCIKYLDRFLMYYLHTAPPLMRTALWLEKLDDPVKIEEENVYIGFSDF